MTFTLPGGLLEAPLQDVFDDASFEPATFAASLNAHGMYETMRFVLRLSPRNHELMEPIERGDFNMADLTPEMLRAYSTCVDRPCVSAKPHSKVWCVRKASTPS